jgi:hypothetical protein
MKLALVGYANHIHYMMDSELFLRQLDQLYVWRAGGPACPRSFRPGLPGRQP